MYKSGIRFALQVGGSGWTPPLALDAVGDSASEEGSLENAAPSPSSGAEGGNLQDSRPILIRANVPGLNSQVEVVARLELPRAGFGRVQVRGFGKCWPGDGDKGYVQSQRLAAPPCHVHPAKDCR